MSLTPDGISSFAGLQQALSRKQTAGLVYYAFDLLHSDGWDLRNVELEHRKVLLRDLLARTSGSRIQFVDHVVGNGEEFLSHCRSLQLEGMVSKRRRAPYRSGRSGDWLKIKCVRVQPFTICGYTTLKGRTAMRSLVLGFRDDQDRLKYVGRVGTGFDEKTLVALESHLKRLASSACPFDRLPPKNRTGRCTGFGRKSLRSCASPVGRRTAFCGIRRLADWWKVSAYPWPPNDHAARSESAGQ